MAAFTGAKVREKSGYTGQTTWNRGRNMRHSSVMGGVALIAGSLFFSSIASAQDNLKLVIGQIDCWCNQAPQLGQDAGIFEKHGLVLENFGSQGTGESMQAVIGGSADIAVAVGAAGVMRAYANGAPVRIILPAFTGAGDQYWYVRADSPIKTLADTNEKTTISYSASGSSTHNVVLGFLDELSVKGVAVATGSQTGTFTSVMSGQVDIGWALPPFGLDELKKGTIRAVARGSDVPSLRDQTVRVTIANANALRERPEVFERFAAAYRESLEWMYSDPRATEMYSQKSGVPADIVDQAVNEYMPREAMQADELKDFQGVVKDALKLKFLTEPLTDEQLEELVEISPKG